MQDKDLNNENFKKQHEENSNGILSVDNKWIEEIVREKYKYYGLEEIWGINFNDGFMKHENGDRLVYVEGDISHTEKWASVNWYIRNLNTICRDLLKNLEMLPKEKVKEGIIFAYNKQIEVFQDWDLKKGDGFKSMEELTKFYNSKLHDKALNIYRLKWLFISASFIKFYKIILDKYFLEQSEASATVEKDKKELIFDNLFPSVEDKEMVMKMLVGLKIINLEGEYLLGSSTGMIRVFIDVMKEEGYFVSIDRKPILRVFTPVILGRMVDVIKEPSDFEVKKRQIIKKLIELKK